MFLLSCSQLRRAFDAMVRDPEFVADLKTQKLDLGPLTGEELQKLVEEVANVPPAILASLRQRNSARWRRNGAMRSRPRPPGCPRANR